MDLNANTSVTSLEPQSNKDDKSVNILVIVLIIAFLITASLVGIYFYNKTKIISLSTANSQQTTSLNVPVSTSVDNTERGNIRWVKYDNSIPSDSNTSGIHGQLPTGLDGSGDSFSVTQPNILKVGNLYKMWYVGADAKNVGRIYYAESKDGLTWKKIDNSVPPVSDTGSNNGRIGLGSAGRGDSVNVSTPMVVVDKSELYQMWYGGYDGKNWRIFHASSPDGLTWTKNDNGELVGTSGKGDNDVLSPYVIWDGQKQIYNMWYRGDDSAGLSNIFMATSSDGLTWTKVGNQGSPVLAHGSSGSVDEDFVRNPTVVKLGNTYHMWYVGGYKKDSKEIQTLLHATSGDGIVWTKDGDPRISGQDYTNGVLATSAIVVGGVGSGDVENLGGPDIFMDKNTLKMFYFASAPDSSKPTQSKWRIFQAWEYNY